VIVSVASNVREETSRREDAGEGEEGGRGGRGRGERERRVVKARRVRDREGDLSYDWN